MATLTPATVWDNQTVQNGEIGDANNLNKGPRINRVELDELWRFTNLNQDSFPDNDTLLRDDLKQDTSITDRTLSIQGIHGITLNGGTWS